MGSAQNVLHICADPRFLWHHNAIWNASCSQDANLQVPTRGPPRLVSQVACCDSTLRLIFARMYKDREEASVSISRLLHRLLWIIILWFTNDLLF